jgi:Holliday junction resolvase RusA-like endonuclease
MLKIEIPGTPRTKKNSQIMVKGRNLILPSKAFSEYQKFCIGTKTKPGWLMQWGNICYTVPVQVTCFYWFPDNRSKPDLVGLLQATSDILEKAGILENDRLIASYDGSRIMGIDKEHPRAEITITEMDDYKREGL